jgi:transcription antitermination factor NusG
MDSCVEKSSPTPWVALVVKPRAESKVQAGLTTAQLENFVPWHKVRRQWSDRVKTLAQNLFPGYVFCRSTFAERMVVMNQPGVRGVVSFDRTPALIPDAEIAALRRVLDSGLPVGPWPHLEAGQRVRIDQGALAGTEGRLTRDSMAWRLVLSVDALQRSVAVEVDRDMIRVLNDASR